MLNKFPPKKKEFFFSIAHQDFKRWERNEFIILSYINCVFTSSIFFHSNQIKFFFFWFAEQEVSKFSHFSNKTKQKVTATKLKCSVEILNSMNYVNLLFCCCFCMTSEFANVRTSFFFYLNLRSLF